RRATTRHEAGASNERGYQKWSSSGPVSIGNEAVFSTVVLARSLAAGHAVDAIDIAKQVRLGIRRVGKTVIRARQVLLRNGAHDVRRDNHRQFRLPVCVVAAPEQRAKDG